MTWIIQVLSNTWSDLTRFKWFKLKLMTGQDIDLTQSDILKPRWSDDYSSKQQEDYIVVFQFKRRIKAFHQHQVQTDQSRTEQVNKTFNLHPLSSSPLSPLVSLRSLLPVFPPLPLLAQGPLWARLPGGGQGVLRDTSSASVLDIQHKHSVQG